MTNNHCSVCTARPQEKRATATKKYLFEKEIRRKNRRQIQLEEDGDGSMRQSDGDKW